MDGWSGEFAPFTWIADAVTRMDGLSSRSRRPMRQNAVEQNKGRKKWRMERASERGWTGEWRVESVDRRV